MLKISRILKALRPLSLLLVMTVALAACSGIKKEAKYPTGYDRNTTGGDIYGKKESIFGDGGLSIGGDRGKTDEATGITVNSFLWRASLDTVSFMPLASADPFGGTILTDWYTPDPEKGERYKLNVFILSKQLRSDGVQVRVFKQVRQNGSWFDAAPTKEMARQLEDSILTRARQLRIAQLGD
jgi:hypothetical protein